MQNQRNRGVNRLKRIKTDRVFGKELLEWSAKHPRDMAWRKTRDPYKIWVSEVLLQQTRVEQALPYYKKFLRKFPSVEALAASNVNEVLKAWEGAGYYARARNLHRAANIIVEKYGGKIPANKAALAALPGFGPYTTAAVLSLAFGKDYAVLDGNVERVLCRVFAVKQEAGKAETKKWLQNKAQELLLDGKERWKRRRRHGTVSQEIRGYSRSFNLALMDVGATVCTPKKPDCQKCPFKSLCLAHQEGGEEAYPVRKKGRKIPHYEVAVGVIRRQGRVLILQRPFEKFLGGLWELPGGKREKEETLREACKREIREETGLKVRAGPLIARVKHAYSHFKITMYAFDCTEIRSRNANAHGERKGRQPVARALDDHVQAKWVPLARVRKYAFPAANRKVFERLGA